MRTIYLSEQDEQVAFAKKAAAHFASHTHCTTFTDGDIKRGGFLAIRWGAGNDCVAVLKLDDNHEPVIYASLIQQEPRP